MRSIERDILATIHGCLTEMETLGPGNPAHLKRHVQVSHLSRKVAGKLASALSSLGYADYDLAREYVADARQLLDEDREKCDA